MYKGEGIAVIIISVIDTALSLDITLGIPPRTNNPNFFLIGNSFGFFVYVTDLT